MLSALSTKAQAHWSLRRHFKSNTAYVMYDVVLSVECHANAHFDITFLRVFRAN